MKKMAETARWVWGQAKKHGAGGVRVQVTTQIQTETVARAGKLEKSQAATRAGLSLAVYSDGRYSINNTSDLRPDSLKKFVQNCVELTTCMAKDEFRQLPEPKYYPEKVEMDRLEIFDRHYDRVGGEDRVEKVMQVEEAARKESDKLISTSAGLMDNKVRSLLFASNGLEAAIEATSFTISADASVRDGQRGRPEDYWYGSSRYWKDLPDGRWVGKEAVKRAMRRIGQDKIASGKYDMIVTSDKAWRILKLLLGPINAGQVQQKRSFLDGKIGQKIGSHKLTIIDDPQVVRGIGSRAFDEEGITAKRLVMVEKGVLQNYYVDSYYGRKLNLEPNSGSSSNIIIECGQKSEEELVKGIKRGILVTDFIGGNSNNTTGDFSIGVSGRLIENGQAAGSVSGMNIAGNSKELWNRLVETSKDAFLYATVRSPAMMFEGVDFSGL